MPRANPTTMLKDGREVRILFRHAELKDADGQPTCSTEDRAVEASDGTMVVINKSKTFDRYTECRIVSGPKDAEVLEGWAQSWKAVGDQFDRRVGREIALKRAVKCFGREDAGRLLAAYYNRNKESVRKGKEVTNSNQTEI